MAHATGEEVVRQTGQLKRIDGRVDEANERLNHANKRMDKIAD